MLKVLVNDNNRYALSENDQDAPSLFALVERIETGEYSTITPLFMCRDYLNDQMFVQYDSSHCIDSVYGFNAKYNKDLERQLNNKYTYMLFNYDADAYGNFKALHAMEEDLGFSLTSLLEIEVAVTTGGHTWDDWVLLKVDSDWFANGVILSLYTEALRLLAYPGDTYEEITNSSEAENSTDNDFLQLFKDDKMMFFLDHWRDITGVKVPHPLTEEEVSEDFNIDERHVDCIHDGGGIMSFYNGITASNPEFAEPAVRQWVTNFHTMWNKENTEAA